MAASGNNNILPHSTCFRLPIFSAAAATVNGMHIYILTPLICYAHTCMYLYICTYVCRAWSLVVLLSVCRPAVIISQRHSSIAHALDLKICDDILPKQQRYQQQQQHAFICMFVHYVASISGFYWLCGMQLQLSSFEKKSRKLMISIKKRSHNIVATCRYFSIASIIHTHTCVREYVGS